MQKANGANGDGRWTFFREFVKHPLQIGSVIPSSHFLERRVVEAARIRSARTIVELGPGCGGTTRALLREASPRSRVLCIELNPRLHALVSGIDDERLIVHLGGALSLRETLSRYGLDAPDAVVSGIPFSTMSAASGSQIVREVSAVLAPGGCFVAYQLSGRVAELCRPVLGAERVELELRNLPPMRVYRWAKAKD
ncbi:MAG: methyltransferase type 12 [Deltaproteobacteria bacterium]|nr:methyltransferase type 12 [Deltaproteobacteria bacterium]